MAKIIATKAKTDPRQKLLDSVSLPITASDFSDEQLEIIFTGIRENLDVNIYANTAHSAAEMQDLLTLMRSCSKTPIST